MKRHISSVVVTVVISLIVLIYSLVTWPSLERLILVKMKSGAGSFSADQEFRSLERVILEPMRPIVGAGMAWGYERELHAEKSTEQTHLVLKDQILRTLLYPGRGVEEPIELREK